MKLWLARSSRDTVLFKFTVLTELVLYPSRLNYSEAEITINFGVFS
jgi:hypothetical protein